MRRARGHHRDLRSSVRIRHGQHSPSSVEESEGQPRIWRAQLTIDMLGRREVSDVLHESGVRMEDVECAEG